MKLAIALLLSALSFLSCKKENEYVPLRCGTVFNQPVWAKHFSKDSLYTISHFAFVYYTSQLPSGQYRDTSYSMLVPVQFNSNGTGTLNNNIAFNYNVVLTQSYPEIHISGLNDVSPLFPFSNNFLNQTVIRFRAESFLKAGGEFAFTNGVEYPLASQTYESCFLAFKRN